MEFNCDDYVSEAEARLRYPNGAEIVMCRYCPKALVVESGAERDCGRHLN
jgi:hypothetical protein